MIGKMVDDNFDCGVLSSDQSESQLEERVIDSINKILLPRKSFEIMVNGTNGGLTPSPPRPLTTKPEIRNIARSILMEEGVDIHTTNDTTQWDVFWATEYAAAMALISTKEQKYGHILPGRHLMYGLLSDTISHLALDVRGKRVAEIGSGSGLSLSRLARRGAQATGLDISRIALKFSNYLSHHYGTGGGVHLVRGDYNQLPFNSDSFDVTYNAGVLEHLTPDEATTLLQTMKYVTKPGGYVLISVPNVGSPFYRNLKEREREIFNSFKDMGYVRLPWESRRFDHNLRKMFEAQGLEVVKEDGLQIAPSRMVRSGDIRREDLHYFAELLPQEPLKTIDSFIAHWRRMEVDATPEQRRHYGWSIYIVGKK